MERLVSILEDPSSGSIASNNAQIITFGALITGTPNAIMYTDIWLKNNFQSERSGNKVEKINQLDG